MLIIQMVARAAGAAIVVVFALVAVSACGKSTKASYAFSTTTQEVSLNSTAVVDVRIVKLPDGKPVENAVIFDLRLDMSPEAMGDMTAPVTAEGSPGPGVYRFAVAPTMAGRWELKLSARVQGDPDIVSGTVTVMAR